MKMTWTAMSFTSAWRTTVLLAWITWSAWQCSTWRPLQEWARVHVHLHWAVQSRWTLLAGPFSRYCPREWMTKSPENLWCSSPPGGNKGLINQIELKNCAHQFDHPCSLALGLKKERNPAVLILVDNLVRSERGWQLSLAFVLVFGTFSLKKGQKLVSFLWRFWGIIGNTPLGQKPFSSPQGHVCTRLSGISKFVVLNFKCFLSSYIHNNLLLKFILTVFFSFMVIIFDINVNFKVLTMGLESCSLKILKSTGPSCSKQD